MRTTWGWSRRFKTMNSSRTLACGVPTLSALLLLIILQTRFRWFGCDRSALKVAQKTAPNVPSPSFRPTSYTSVNLRWFFLRNSSRHRLSRSSPAEAAPASGCATLTSPLASMKLSIRNNNASNSSWPTPSSPLPRCLAKSFMICSSPGLSTWSSSHKPPIADLNSPKHNRARQRPSGSSKGFMANRRSWSLLCISSAMLCLPFAAMESLPLAAPPLTTCTA
mmetsp:Transcript_17525/g.48048  ORF Transcript_17525/g.48048 Transcript_17525/m.48048 type:complete len:222 (+) Transcript_17525:1295-1960(+)